MHHITRNSVLQKLTIPLWHLEAGEEVMVASVHHVMHACDSLYTSFVLSVNEGVSNPLYEDLIIPNSNEMISKLHSVADKWFLIGLQLKLPTSVLNTIRRGNPTAEACLEKMCEKWLEACGEEEPSWLDVVRALESRVVCESRLASTIRVYYCDDTALENNEFYTKVYRHAC